MDRSILTNRTFDELAIGESASLVRIVGRDDIDLFATVSENSVYRFQNASDGKSA